MAKDLGRAVLPARDLFPKVCVFCKGSKADLLEEGQLFLGFSAGAMQNGFGCHAINIGVLPSLAIILISLFSAKRHLSG